MISELVFINDQSSSINCDCPDPETGADNCTCEDF